MTQIKVVKKVPTRMDLVRQALGTVTKIIMNLETT